MKTLDLSKHINVYRLRESFDYAGCYASDDHPYNECDHTVEQLLEAAGNPEVLEALCDLVLSTAFGNCITASDEILSSCIRSALIKARY